MPNLCRLPTLSESTCMTINVNTKLSMKGAFKTVYKTLKFTTTEGVSAWACIKGLVVWRELPRLSALADIHPLRRGILVGIKTCALSCSHKGFGCTPPHPLPQGRGAYKRESSKRTLYLAARRGLAAPLPNPSPKGEGLIKERVQNVRFILQR